LEFLIQKSSLIDNGSRDDEPSSSLSGFTSNSPSMVRQLDIQIVKGKYGVRICIRRVNGTKIVMQGELRQQMWSSKEHLARRISACPPYPYPNGGVEEGIDPVPALNQRVASPVLIEAVPSTYGLLRDTENLSPLKPPEPRLFLDSGEQVKRKRCPEAGPRAPISIDAGVLTLSL
jgi:hypothetical protein